MPSKGAVDVLLIGSGGSGGPFAWLLSTAPKLKILCLEQGDWDAGIKHKAAASRVQRRNGLAHPHLPEKGFDTSRTAIPTITPNHIGNPC
jgi:choline dehydrogenase-like flavoprotein